MATKRLWRWRGVDAQGAPCQGMLWQASRPEVLHHLQQQRILPLAIRRCTVKQSLWHPRYSSETIRQLATLLQAGLPLAEGLSLLAQQQPHGQWQALLEALGRELAQGVTFSAALAQWPQAFPPLYLAMISTGELTGKLDICCQQLANQQQEQQRLAGKVKKALRYPLIVLTLALLVVLGMLYFVLPEFTAIYQTFNTPLPLLTRMVIAAGDMLSRGWPLLLAFLLSPLLLNQLVRQRDVYKRQDRGRLDIPARACLRQQFAVRRGGRTCRRNSGVHYRLGQPEQDSDALSLIHISRFSAV